MLISFRSVEPNLDSFSNTNIGFAMQWPELCKPVGKSGCFGRKSMRYRKVGSVGKPTM